MERRRRRTVAARDLHNASAKTGPQVRRHPPKGSSNLAKIRPWLRAPLPDAARPSPQDRLSQARSNAGGACAQTGIDARALETTVAAFDKNAVNGHDRFRQGLAGLQPLPGRPAASFSASTLHRLSASGELEWSRRIQGGANAHDVLPTPDDGLLLVGQVAAAARRRGRLDGEARCARPPGRHVHGRAGVRHLHRIRPDLQPTPTSRIVDDRRWRSRMWCVSSTPALTEVSESCNATGTCLVPTVQVDVPASACVGTTIAALASASGTGPFTYEWDFDWDGVTFDVDGDGPRGGTRAGAGNVDGGQPRDGRLRLARAGAVNRERGARRRRESLASGHHGTSRRCSDNPCTVLEVPPGQASYSWRLG